MLHDKHGVTSRSCRVTNIVRLLSVVGFGSTQIGLLFPTLVFLVALLAIVLAIDRLVLMTPLSCGGSLTPIDHCIQPLSISVIMGARP